MHIKQLILLGLTLAGCCGRPVVNPTQQQRDIQRPGGNDCIVCGVVACLSPGGDRVDAMRLLVLHQPGVDGVTYKEGIVTVKPSGSLGGVATQVDVGDFKPKTLMERTLGGLSSQLATTSAWKDAKAEVELVWDSPAGMRSEVFTVSAGIGKCD